MHFYAEIKILLYLDIKKKYMQTLYFLSLYTDIKIYYFIIIARV